jgi:excisionase family DNA binding protein
VNLVAESHEYKADFAARLLPLLESVMIVPNFQEREILTVKEVSELLKVHQGTVYKMVREGRIPAFKIGSDWRFRKDQMVHWIAEQTIAAAQ